MGTENPRAGLLHVRAPSPIRFPVEEEVPESKRHILLRTLLYEVLRAFADRHSIGCDQFVYWSASNPKLCLSPDGFVRLGQPDRDFTSWKTWKHGAPELCVEIVSEFDRSARSWKIKLSRYHALGVRELVRFDPDAPEGGRIRVWDRVEGDLVERVVEQDWTPCTVLDLSWVASPYRGYLALRLARDPDGHELVLTEAETAERRVHELEEELRRRG